MRLVLACLVIAFALFGCDAFQSEPVKPSSKLLHQPPEIAPNESLEAPIEPMAEQPAPIKVKSLPEHGDTPLSQIFDFAKVSTIRYRLILYEKGIPDLHYVNATVRTGIYRERPVWVFDSVWGTNNISRRDELFIDQATLLCLARNFSTSGKIVSRKCPVLGPFGASRTSLNVQFSGSEEFYGGGNFSNFARRFLGDGVIYYTNLGVAFPLKYTVLNGTLVYQQVELDSYS